MQEHKFDDVLNYLCSGIMSKAERQSVRDELYDHLMCRYETNIAVGMDETEAEKNAVDALGDKSMLKFKLSQVHSYAPKPTLKKAINLFRFSISLYMFSAFFVSFEQSFYDGYIFGLLKCLMFAGAVAVVVSMFCLRTANKKLNKAFGFKIAEFALYIISAAVAPVGLYSFGIGVLFEIVGRVFEIAFWIYTLNGLHELVKPYVDSEKEKELHLSFCIFANLTIPLAVIISSVLYFLDGDYYRAGVGLGGSTGAAVGLLWHYLSKLSKILWNSDHEYKIEDSSAKKWIAAVLAVVIAIVPTVAVDFALAGQKAETSVYSVDDTDIPQSEYERICSNLLSYGIPEKIVYSLPESEILKYSDSINKNDYDEETLKYLGDPCYSHDAEICNDVNAVFSVCAVGMSDSDGYPYVRIISWVEYLSTGKGYDDALFWGCLQKNLILYNSYEAYEGDFLLILSEENGKIIKNEPLDIYTDKNGLTDRMTGVRFESKEKMTLIHAETFGLSSNKGVTYANYYLQLAHRVSPFTLFYRSPLTVKENNVRQNGMGYMLCNENTMISWCSPDSAEE